jgi:hypothetical protein
LERSGTVENWSLGKITGGNADSDEKKELEKIATQKLMKTKGKKYHRFRGAVRVAEERRGETGTLSVRTLTKGYRIAVCLSSD